MLLLTALSPSYVKFMPYTYRFGPTWNTDVQLPCHCLCGLSDSLEPTGLPLLAGLTHRTYMMSSILLLAFPQRTIP